jgi:hypothetical protein
MRGSAEYSNGGASLLSTGSQETMLPSKEVADHVKKEIRRHSSHRHAVSTAVIDPDDNDFSSHSGHHHLAARSGVAKAALANAFWTRPLAYGECMKLHVDFHDRQLFFVTPHKADVCKLSRSRVLELSEPEVDPGDEDVLEDDVAEGTEAAPDEPTRAAVVLTQLKASDSRCSLQSQTLTRKRSRYGAAAAELALLDAFTQPKLDPIMLPDVNGDGVAEVPPLEVPAVVRLEDVIAPEAISSEIVASRTLGFNSEFAVEPKKLHVILEDIRGETEFSRLDVLFKPNKTYVGVRIGLSGNPDFPERLAFYSEDQEDA